MSADAEDGHSTDPGGDAVAAAALSDALRDAFARVAAAPLVPDEKRRWQERLLAITTTAKRDTPRAAKQLARVRADWQAAGNDAAADPPS